MAKAFNYWECGIFVHYYYRAMKNKGEPVSCRVLCANAL